MPHSPEFEPLAYSIKEACAACRVGRTTLYAAIARGDLKTKKIGRRTLIGSQDLRSWLESCTADVASNTKEVIHE
jgi:excisionase family DNA binding protein